MSGKDVIQEAAQSALEATLARREEESRRNRLALAAGDATVIILQSLMEDPSAESLQARIAEGLGGGGGVNADLAVLAPRGAGPGDDLSGVIRRLDALSRSVEAMLSRPDATEALARESARIGKAADGIERALAALRARPTSEARAPHTPYGDMFGEHRTDAGHPVATVQDAPPTPVVPAGAAPPPAAEERVPAAAAPVPEAPAPGSAREPRRGGERRSIAAGKPRDSSLGGQVADVAYRLACSSRNWPVLESEIKDAVVAIGLKLDGKNPRFIQNALAPYWMKIDGGRRDAINDLWWPADEELPGGIAMTPRRAWLPRNPEAARIAYDTVQRHMTNYPSEVITCKVRKGTDMGIVDADAGDDDEDEVERAA